MLQADTVLVERYRLRERVGGGGMGDVWRGDDLVLGRDVAIKVLRTDRSESRHFKERFRREARAVAALNGPGIVDIYDYGETSQDHGALAFLVMRYVHGQPLSRLLACRGRLPPAETLHIVSQVADALHLAHERGIIHRDIKPGNILVQDDSRVVVVDFGIARTSANLTLTTTGVVLGTVTYMSPEQASGERLGPASDLYSLGVVAHQCLTGEPPFRAETPVEMISAHLQGRPIVMPAWIPPRVQGLVLRAMARRPQDRFGSATAFATACRQLTALQQPMMVNAETTGHGRAAVGTPPRPPAAPRQSTHSGSATPRPPTATGSAPAVKPATASAQPVKTDTDRPDGTPPRPTPRPSKPPRRGRPRSFGKGLFTVCALALAFSIIGTIATVQPWKPHRVAPGISSSSESEAAHDRSPSPSGLRGGQLPAGEDETPLPTGSAGSRSPHSSTPQPTSSSTGESTSPPPTMVNVPDVLSRDEAGARDAITSAGLDPAVIYAGEGELTCTVISQDPRGGQQIEEGSTVTVTVERATESCPD